MSKCYNDPFVATINDNNVVWESAQNEALCSVFTGTSRHGGKWKEIVFYYINSSFNCLSKLGAKALPFLLVPNGRRFSLFRSLTENSYLQI